MQIRLGDGSHTKAALSFCKGGHDNIIKALEALGVTITADISTEQEQADFAPEVLTAKESGADALFAYLNEAESAKLLTELRKQGYDKPIFGETMLPIAIGTRSRWRSSERRARPCRLERRQTTLVVIEHNMEFIFELAHRIIVLAEGQVLMSGTPDEIRRDPKVIEAYLGS